MAAFYCATRLVPNGRTELEDSRKLSGYAADGLASTRVRQTRRVDPAVYPGQSLSGRDCVPNKCHRRRALNLFSHGRH